MSKPQDEKQMSEWQALYLRLLTVLASCGKDDPFGNGAYWVVDDNWGTNVHKVCVFEISILTPELIKEVQKQLLRIESEWSVMFQLELKDPRFNRNPKGLIVYKNRVEEHWNKLKLKEQLKDDFKWI